MITGGKGALNGTSMWPVNEECREVGLLLSHLSVYVDCWC